MYLLTIIVPIYNTEKYLEECLESLVSQTSKDFCVLLIDDGSPDGCGQICDRYASQYRFIKVIHKENGGLCSVRNIGIQNLETEWFAFVDSDDFVSNNYVEGLIQPIKLHSDLDFVQAGCLKYLSTGETSECQSYENYVGKDKLLVFNKFRGLSCSKLFKTDIVRFHNIQFDSNLVYAEDYIFTMDYLCYVNKYCLSSEVGYFYRQVEGSLSRKVCDDYEKLSYYVGQKYYFADRYISTYNLCPNQVAPRLKQISTDLSWLMEIMLSKGKSADIKKVSDNYPRLISFLPFEKRIVLAVSKISVSLVKPCWYFMKRIERAYCRLDNVF